MEPVPSFNTKIEAHRQAEKIDSDADTGLLICGTNEGAAAFTEFKEWKGHLTENLMLDSIDVKTIPKGIYTVMVNLKIAEDGSLSEFKITNDPGYGLSNKVAEAVNKYKGKWNPVQNQQRIWLLIAVNLLRLCLKIRK